VKKRLDGLLKDIASASVAIVGDVMLDEYIIGDTERISPEAPEPIIEERERIYIPGAAGNVALNISELGAHARLFSVIGNDQDGIQFRRILRGAGVDDNGILTVDHRPTTRKTRLIARGNQMLRVDRETTDPIDTSTEKLLVESISALSEDVIVVSDYAKGVVTTSLLLSLTDTGKKVIVDPKSTNFSKYSGTFLVTPNYVELCRAAGTRDIPRDEIETVSREMMDKYDIAHFLITLGLDGMLLVAGEGPVSHIHTQAREVYDVTGAGDTVIAALSSAVAAGATLTDACYVANIAAGIVVGKHKTAAATPGEIMNYAFGPSASEKIVETETVKERVAELKNAGKKVVFTNGCFDLLHIGHITYLNEARELGDILVVGLNTDRSVRKLKGENRPIIPEMERSHVLAALECVDYVVLFDEEKPLNLIKAVRPDVLVKGADYTKEQVVGHEIVESYGGTVSLIPVINNASTTTIIKRIKETS